jgi:pimeloyl-ACP methyl ester carboxylesterase
MVEFRKYGEAGYAVVLVHGGPGAAGEMAPVARQLANYSGVLEPFQTKHSIQGQVEELKEIILNHADAPVSLIGFSWGAWLSIIFASQFKDLVDRLIIIGCGPLEQKYASGIYETRLKRLSHADRNVLNNILMELEEGSTKDKNKDMEALGKIMAKADSYDPIPEIHEDFKFDEGIYKAVWKEAEKMRESGLLLSCIENISCPVVAIHGDYDPHPSSAVIQPFSAMSTLFSFHVLSNCGHKPWIERNARNTFYEILLANLPIKRII